MNTLSRLLILLVAASVASPAAAHHSYAMFDGSARRTVQGTLAKVEWSNPHVLIWLYVRNAATDGYVLYAFESDSANGLRRQGWTNQSLKPGEPVTIEFFGLRDGRSGGHFIKATKADGTVLEGVPGPINGLEAQQ